MKYLLIFTIVLITSACSIPKEMRTDSIPAVKNFELEKYLGKWYEIARLPHSFEDGLIKVSAEYSLDEDGDIKVINRGFDTEDNEWQEAEGVAGIVNKNNPAVLEVSFFRPFYAEYKVIKLERDYSIAMVTSSSKKYLWILSRSRTIEPKMLELYIETAKNFGFNTNDLIVVEQVKQEKE